MTKIIKISLILFAAIGLSFSFVLGASAEDKKVDGKCKIVINTKHTLEKRAIATGGCKKLVSGYYGSGQFHVEGGHDGTVIEGEKYHVTIMPGFYTYEVTVHTIRQNQRFVAPAVSEVGTSDKKVTGTTEPKMKVVVKSGKTTLGASTADKSGKYNISMKKSLKVGTKLTVTAKKGTESKSKTVKVKYNAPVSNVVNPTSTKVTGITESKAKVTVREGSKVLGTATANKSGKYIVKIKQQKVGTKLSINAYKSGNTTKTKIVNVK